MYHQNNTSYIEKYDLQYIYIAGVTQTEFVSAQVLLNLWPDSKTIPLYQSGRLAVLGSRWKRRILRKLVLEDIQFVAFST